MREIRTECGTQLLFDIHEIAALEYAPDKLKVRMFFRSGIYQFLEFQTKDGMEKFLAQFRNLE